MSRAARDGGPTLRTWLAPPLTALVFLLHPTLSLLRPAPQLQDPGIGGHLATGRYILATATIPDRDPFSFTAAGQPWIVHSWLFSTIGALLERAGGLPLYATACMLLLACVPVLLYRRMLKIGAGILPALLVTFVAEIVLMSHALARPHVVTYLLFAVFLDRLDDVAAGRRGARALAWLVPLMTLWCNVHGGFVTGLAVTAVYAAVAAAHLVSRGQEARRRALAFGGLLFGLVAATAVNPRGFALLHDVVHHLATSGAAALLDEWRSPNFQSPTIPILAFETLVLATIAVAVTARRRLAWVELALLAVFLHASLHAARHVSLFAIVAAPLVARELSRLLARARPAFAARWRAIADEQRMLRAPLLYFPAIVALIVGLAWSGRTGFPRTLDDQQLSRGAAAFIAGNTERFARPFNTDDVGGALIDRFWPAVRVFVDDRIDVYGDAFVTGDYMAVLAARPAWRDVLARWGVDAAIVGATTPAASVLRQAPEWEVAFEDERNVIFWRRPS